MATHEVNKKNLESVFDLYTQDSSLKSLKKFKISESTNDPEIIKDLILDELLLDGNAKQNLSAFRLHVSNYTDSRF